MRTVLLINPNTSGTTTSTMSAIARDVLGPRYRVHAVTARAGPAIIMDGAALDAAASEVLALTVELTAARPAPDAIIVAAFGDPAVDEIRDTTGIPTTGIAEAAIREAAAGGRRFGIATTTPELVAAIEARVAALGLHRRFSGIRLTTGHPRTLMADPELLHARLAEAVRDCVGLDHAQAVIIGGGPLAAAAQRLPARFEVPLVAPVPAACRAVHRILADPARRPGG